MYLHLQKCASLSAFPPTPHWLFCVRQRPELPPGRAHQAFFTEEGIGQIAKVSLNNIKLYLEGHDDKTHPNVVK